ncbi:D-2-hydroxyacid dehydrogenase [Kineococcus radiotolerans]|uniref:D-isomer specific 2-hydroxyacid dehydrogenase NAD-binding n=1 Tax=Kineococcus radiotolerans (strain ATCC BAA-149 / DSM 14245 / SRS30216) TaxID=266940 RepID=A6W4U1_KINRD|nr:D-2-hydroxyacid dehydrogenase [Kineococcus radiotolerans]ABS01830.1 D-isomer specific 2-hydroxyacid dehydrogenase NAD-binding [Kineococcus radiotolerans SRS30216 = ATCC BAA-149]
MTGTHDVLIVPVGSAPDPAPLRELTDVRVVDPHDPALPAALAAADGLVVWDGSSPALERAWEAADPRRLRWVHTSSAGPDRLLFPALRAHPCVLTCSRGVLDTDIAEYVLACVLALLKDLPRTVALQAGHRWLHRGTRSLAGRRALVVGAGSIGTRTAKLFSALGVHVDGIVRTPRPAAAPFGSLSGPQSLPEVVGDYDLVLVTAPLSEATRGLVSREVVARMRPATIVVNVGRGPVVDEDALLEALQENRISGVALDVWATEPLPADSPWWDLPGALVSPHLAGDAEGFTDRLEELLREQVRRFAVGEPLHHVVDKTHGYAVAPTVAR